MAKILIYTFLLAAIPLVIVTVLQIVFEKATKIMKHIPEAQKEERGFSLYLLQFLSDLFFFVIIPAIIYYWVYPVMPFSGFKTGVAIGIGAYILGSLPYATSLSLRIKVPPVVIVSTLFFNLLKLSCTIGIITQFMNY